MYTFHKYVTKSYFISVKTFDLFCKVLLINYLTFFIF